jgi:hypothetical protein
VMRDESTGYGASDRAGITKAFDLTNGNEV